MEKIKEFLTYTLWRKDLSQSPLHHRMPCQILRFFMLAGKAYMRDNSLLHASALTYITLLAIVPVLVLGLTSLKAFGADELAREKIMGYIHENVGQIAQPTTTPAQPTAANTKSPAQTKQEQGAAVAEKLQKIADDIFEQINSINFAKIGGVGAISLIISVILVLGKIEQSFNHIWGVLKNRPLWRKFTDYLSVLIVVPLLLIASSTIPVMDMVHKVNPNVGRIAAFISSLGVINALVPLLITTLLFAFLFGFLPNTKINLKSCFLGAFLTALMIRICFMIFMKLQVGIGGNSVLYGSFAALPIVLFWIHASWQIVLFGAEICYVHQHHDELLRESAFTHPSQRDHIMIAIAICIEAARSISGDNKPMDMATFARKLRLPLREQNLVIDVLTRHKIIIPILDDDGIPTGMILSCCATRLRIVDIIRAFIDDYEGEDIEQRSTSNDILHAINTKFNTALETTFSTPISTFIQ